MNKFFKLTIQFVILCVLQGAAYAQTLLTGLQVEKSDGYSSFIFNIHSPKGYKVFTLSNPNRIVVDIKEGHLRTSTSNLDLSETPITSVRHGRFDDHTFRLVLDVSGKLPKYNATLREVGGDKSQLVLDIYGNGIKPVKSVKPKAQVEQQVAKPSNVSVKRALSFGSENLVTKQEKQIAEEVKVEREKNDWRTSSKPKSSSLNTITPTKIPQNTAVTSQASPSLPKLQAWMQANKIPEPRLTEAYKARKVIVVIDAGHGGKDPGTIGKKGTQEKDVVLSIATQLATLINQQPNMHALLTRDGDYFVTLRDRLRLARKVKGDLFVSIHADSYFDNQLTGASIFALSQHGATTEAARWLARRENYSELGGVSLGNLDDQSYVLRSVLIDLAQTATIDDSIKLGGLVLNDLGKVTSLHYMRVEQAPFMVLKSPDIPSILVETGFLSSPSEEARLSQASYRNQLARAILNGIRQYVATHPTTSTTTAT